MASRGRWVLRGVLALAGVGMIGGSALWAAWYHGPRSVRLDGCYLVNDRELEVGWFSGAGREAITMSMSYDDSRLVVDVREDDAGGMRPAIGVPRTMRTTIAWFAAPPPGQPLVMEDGTGQTITCKPAQQSSDPPQLPYPETS